MVDRMIDGENKPCSIAQRDCPPRLSRQPPTQLPFQRRIAVHPPGRRRIQARGKHKVTAAYRGPFLLEEANQPMLCQVTKGENHSGSVLLNPLPMPTRNRRMLGIKAKSFGAPFAGL